ncbi:linear amide C-N hydrolase [Corallococcus macrosporus]|uniref:Choloylglycine hydrolase family protein n=1 Tax=Myxococcus fulvus (strain ATCC BAA-855 / HW-1) TaxID=483219 RepID=F8C7S7_MYXFH|nr:linear amide C-N hydrolase [Corallococcus macrosporus]AEI65678.1 choloylglycine hydrolase family protein [Corallococcus macrosporus]
MCTNFLIVAKDSSAVVGRSMEFGVDLHSKLRVHAPGETFRSPASMLNPHGLTWTSKHGFVGVTGDLFGITAITDGLNTEGLSAGALWMPDSLFPHATDPAKALAPELFVSWALGNFATVDELYDVLVRKEVQIWHSEWLTKLAPLHFPIHDAKGNSLVVEFINGEMNLYTGEDNPVGVLTNHPTFPEQLQNLRNYTRLTPYDTDPVTLGSARFSPHGCGSGMFGLPGDSTPPSRFVRTTYLRQAAQVPTNAHEASVLALHLLNAVDIPLGTSRKHADSPDQEKCDHTLWVVVKDLTNRVLNIRFYDSFAVQSVDLKALDFAAAAKRKSIDVPPITSGIDITARLAG